MTDQKRTLLTAMLAAFAVVAVLAILLAQPRPDDPVLPADQASGAQSSEQATIAAQTEPAAPGPDGAFPNPNIDTSATATTTPFAGATAAPTTPVTTIYATEDECKQATGTACHALSCEDIPEGKTASEICGADFKPGWQALVPSPDRSAVPERVAPPMTTTPESSTAEPSAP